MKTYLVFLFLTTPLGQTIKSDIDETNITPSRQPAIIMIVQFILEIPIGKITAIVINNKTKLQIIQMM